MLTEERYEKIIRYLEQHRTATISALSRELGISESTVRRDLQALDEKKCIVKVRGGATAIGDERFDFSEPSVEVKEDVYCDEKDAIARYAAETIRKNDFVFIDAGTTTERMIDYITENTATYVTNGFNHAKKLAKKNFTVYLVGGRIKQTTEAVIGAEAVDSVLKYNFVKCYLGTNGISLSAGFTTPDPDEAAVKEAAVQKSYITYILADHSKFGQISSVTFAPLEKACLVTDRVDDARYKEKCVLKEVLDD